MKSTLKLEELLVLDWFDGPIEAIARARDAASYHVKHVGDPPITADSVYRLRRLEPDAFSRAFDVAATFLGEPRHPVWAPTWSASKSDLETIDSTITDCLVAADDCVGYSHTVELTNRTLDILWLHEKEARSFGPLEGIALWERLKDQVDNPRK